MLKKVEMYPINNQLLEYLSTTSIESLDLSNEESLDLDRWCTYLSQPESISSQWMPLKQSLTQLVLSKLSSLEDHTLSAILEQFPFITNLNVSHCTLLNGSFIKRLSSSSSSSSSTSHVDRLQTLNLRGCTSLSPDSYSYIKHCNNLEILVLSKTNIGDDDLPMVLSTMDKLMCLKLNHCYNISKQGVAAIARLTTLEHLYLNHCTLLQTENSLQALQHSTTIQHLDISFCFMDDRSVGSSLFTMPALTSLSIQHNCLSTSFIHDLSLSPLRHRLVHLDLRESLHITPVVALRLYPATQLTELFISPSRRSKHNTSDTCKIDLDALYKAHNQIRINDNQIQLNRSSIRQSIVEKQEHCPLILLGEDEKFQASLVKTVLERSNFDVRIACDGKSAFEMFCQTPYFVLVMMDIFMPILDGLSSIRMIRQFEKSVNLKRTPIIICSGNDKTLNSNGQSKGDEGCDAFLSKPLKRNLVDLIMKLTTTPPTSPPSSSSRPSSRVPQITSS
ncbi:hypothetical protein SAMD00019534_076260 [Acytostelium subglobosum LB1]|uniref:hypothetical protein n=1 Tax=Acytostelium subglobosum LB1 TaxID=1410327 RepID=UPI000644D72A|nr:hypothetical protein SAMD00019534_076260 [Acytostelium subglobosum LB1]GAM24451.1 hypothetical protein SAMD00019534_076260 [Acytostelium subglobosum LB1]|eukprot:XP_012752777.1 hypothetical protein SAMD00019534_076260 [Acytostelium subglobosum LB1]